LGFEQKLEWLKPNITSSKPKQRRGEIAENSSIRKIRSTIFYFPVGVELKQVCKQTFLVMLGNPQNLTGSFSIFFEITQKIVSN